MLRSIRIELKCRRQHHLFKLIHLTPSVNQKEGEVNDDISILLIQATKFK